MIIGAAQRARVAAGAASASRRSLYAHVDGRLTALIPMLGVRASAAQIREVLRRLCAEPLALPREGRVSRASRMNVSGTPFQFALTLGPRPPLQFLCEPAAPDASNRERLQAARARIDALMSMLGIDDAADVHGWLDRVAPIDDPDLAADDAGPVWLGAAFTRSAAPSLKIYVNAKWGLPRSRWTRIAALADHVGAAAEWLALRPSLHRALEPLGIALTLCAEAPPEGRVYFRGPGMTFADHEAQAAACASAAVRARMPALKELLLADDEAYATRSAVCSFGLQTGAPPSFKFEVCAHCAFASDAVAHARCHRWLQDGGFDTAVYARFVDVLSPGALSARHTRLHGFVGIAARHGFAFPTLYFDPAAGL